MLFGKSFLSNADYSFNQFGLAYDVKVFDWGFKVFEKRYDADDFDFIENYEKQETGIELYRRGRKLNSFFRYSKFNFNNILNPYDEYFSIGGVGRMTGKWSETGGGKVPEAAAISRSLILWARREPLRNPLRYPLYFLISA